MKNILPWIMGGWMDGFWIISTDGTQSYHFPEYKDRMQVVWQPSMKYAIIVMGDGYDQYESWLLDLTSWDIYKLDLPSEARVVDWKEP